MKKPRGQVETGLVCLWLVADGSISPRPHAWAHSTTSGGRGTMLKTSLLKERGPEAFPEALQSSHPKREALGLSRAGGGGDPRGERAFCAEKERGG